MTNKQDNASDDVMQLTTLVGVHVETTLTAADTTNTAGSRVTTQRAVVTLRQRTSSAHSSTKSKY